MSASKVVSDARYTDITVNSVAKFFNVGLDKARDIIRITTQRGICRAICPLMNQYKALAHVDKDELRGKWAMNFIHTNVKSISQEIGFFIISDGIFVEVWPVVKKQQRLHW